MKKTFICLMFLLSLGVYASPESDEDINFIGLDEAGKEIEIPFSLQALMKGKKKVDFIKPVYDELKQFLVSSAK